MRHAVRQLAAVFEIAARGLGRFVVLLLQRGDVGRLVDDEQRVVRQMVEQRAGREERRVRFDAVEGLAGTQRIDVAIEALALLAVQVGDLHQVAELAQPRRIDDELARRADADGVAEAERALRPRLERADALDVVAEQLDAKRQLLGRGPDVDDAAAAARLARRRHLRLDAIAAGVERAQDVQLLDAFAAPDRDRRAGEFVGRQRALRDGGCAGDDDGWCGDLTPRRGALTP